jgi:hypothetical protein
MIKSLGIVPMVLVLLHLSHIVSMVVNTEQAADSVVDDAAVRVARSIDSDDDKSGHGYYSHSDESSEIGKRDRIGSMLCVCSRAPSSSGGLGRDNAHKFLDRRRHQYKPRGKYHSEEYEENSNGYPENENHEKYEKKPRRRYNKKYEEKPSRRYAKKYSGSNEREYGRRRPCLKYRAVAIFPSCSRSPCRMRVILEK